MQNSQRHSKIPSIDIDNLSSVFGYSVSAASVAFATLLRLGLNSVWDQRLPYLVFFPAIVASGVVGGLGPGIAAIILSAAAVSFFVFQPLYTFQIGPSNDATGLIAFGLTGLLLAVISAAQRQARQDSIASASQAIASRDALSISEERFVTTLRSIGDGVLATDREGKVTFVNSVASDLTGWTENDAVGRDVHEVFDIINETTRQIVANPVDRVLKEGVIVGLANHTILRSRTGHEYSIDDSGAPIRDRGGDLVGAVLIFRDISEQRKIHKAQEARSRRNAIENRISEALRSGQPPEAIQAVATAALGETLGADRCYLSLNNLVSNRIIIRDDWRRDLSFPSLAGEYSVEDVGADTALLYPRDHPLAITDFESDTTLSPVLREYNQRLDIRSIITLGLYGDDSLLAAINVAMTRPREWTEEEIALVQSVATLTLTVVESARLRNQEHNIAVRLQEVLRPTLPDEMIPGLDIKDLYRAALDESSLGGDFFDVFALSQNRYAMVVADLAGKGLKAASQVAVVRYLLRALLYTYSDTSGGVQKAITQLNRILTEQSLITGFATLFAAIYDTRDKLLSYVCCGQEPALYYNKQREETHQLSATGPVLGSFSDAVFEEVSVTLFPGDTVAIFTDGLTECGPDRKNLLEIEGAISLWEDAIRSSSEPLTAADLSSCLLAGALKHAGGRLSDDLCLLTVVVTS